MSDIKGIIRGVVGFDKMPDEDGDFLMAVKYKLRPIDLDFLRKIFYVDANSTDKSVLDMIGPLDINEEQAIALQKYVIDGVIDTKKYYFELHCWQDPAYDWSNGYPIKKNHK